MSMNLNRRNFLFGSAAAMTLAGCATNKVGLRDLKPGEKLRVGVIGCGIQMRHALMNQMLGQDSYCTGTGGYKIVVCCDCDKDRREAAAAQVDKAYGEKGVCKTVADFRKVLADPSIDAVVIATPDHWHAYICVEAMKHGKDVYCEKPLTFSPEESRKVIAAQKKYGRIFQTGSMQRSYPNFRTACMIVQNGGIGNVMYVDANFGIAGKKLGGPSHPLRFFDVPANAAKEGAPNPNCDWNMWLGPAKWRPYSDQLAPRGVNEFYPMFWRFDDDIGTGYNGDWGAHHLDIAQWGLDMDKSGPYKVIRSDEPYSTDLFHGGRRQYGAKMLFKKPYGTVELYHGPFSYLSSSGHGWGTVFYGTDGIVAVARGRIAVWKGTGLIKPTFEIRQKIENCTFMPEKIVAKFLGQQYGTDAQLKKDEGLDGTLRRLEAHFGLANAKVQLYKSPNQVQNFFECVRSRKQTISPAEVGGRGAILCQLLNFSYRYDTGFDWDGAAMDFPLGRNEKGLCIKREIYRNGWDIVV